MLDDTSSLAFDDCSEASDTNGADTSASLFPIDGYLIGMQCRLLTVRFTGACFVGSIRLFTITTVRYRSCIEDDAGIGYYVCVT